jgi:hypothetical protein
MPVLALRDNPPSRFPEQSILDSQKTWWIAKVKSRQEKALARDLLDREMEYYIPYYTKTLSRTDSAAPRKSLLPLFPSYVPFACEKDPWQLLKLGRISTILPVHAQMKFKTELNGIYMAYEKGISIVPAPVQKYDIGQEVRVVAGPLSGITGKFVRMNNAEFLLVAVEGLGGACVAIDARNVIPD